MMTHGKGHPLGPILSAAAAGDFPDADEPVTVFPRPPHLRGAVVAFSGHTYVAADVDRSEVLARLGWDPLAGPVLPGFLAWLAGVVGGVAHCLDMVLVGTGTGAPPSSVQPEPAWQEHHRARHGAVNRRELTGWTLGDGQGVILIGRGLVDRWEAAYEAAPAAPPGTGRALARAALSLVPLGEPVFAQVTPGNARSLRATLAAGFTPVGCEVLVTDPH